MGRRRYTVCMEPQTESRRGIVVLAAIVILLIGAGVFLYINDFFVEIGGTVSNVPVQGELPPPTVDKKTDLYDNLQVEMGANPEPVADEERMRVYQQAQAEQQTQTETTPPPSESDRQKLLEGLE